MLFGFLCCGKRRTKSHRPSGVPDAECAPVPTTVGEIELSAAPDVSGTPRLPSTPSSTAQEDRHQEDVGESSAETLPPPPAEIQPPAPVVEPPEPLVSESSQTSAAVVSLPPALALDSLPADVVHLVLQTLFLQPTPRELRDFLLAVPLAYRIFKCHGMGALTHWIKVLVRELEAFIDDFRALLAVRRFPGADMEERCDWLEKWLVVWIPWTKRMARWAGKERLLKGLRTRSLLAGNVLAGTDAALVRDEGGELRWGV